MDICLYDSLFFSSCLQHYLFNFCHFNYDMCWCGFVWFHLFVGLSLLLVPEYIYIILQV